MPFVLVHGGGFAGSCWDPLIPLLDGPAYAVDLPGRGDRPGDLATVTIAQFVSAVCDVITDNDLTEVVLVGHSMAGLTLPGVAERVPSRLRRLVFVSCTVPTHGTSLAEVLADLSPAVGGLAEHIGDDGLVVDGRGVLHSVVAGEMFCNDMDELLTAFTLERMVPEALGVLGEPCDLTGLRQPIPRTYVRLTQDASVGVDAQNQMIATIGSAEVADLESGHMAMISHPRELAALLNDG
jgi:pimeloyl-ACP methyl ester carboxylesterase